jgi:hypothetical protein
VVTAHTRPLARRHVQGREEAHDGLYKLEPEGRGAMNIEKMTTKAQEAVREAFGTASRKGNPEIHPEHLCLAVVEQEGGVGRPLVQKAGGDYAALVSAL